MLVFVGGGPRTVSLLERISASAGELLPAAGLQIHVIDPFPVGGGRIWRRNQSPLLWMNSVAKDVTMFTDESVVCDGPIAAGPALDAWVVGPGRQVLIDAGLGEQAEAFRASYFASREIQSLYLSWTFDRVLAALPPSVSVQVHRQRAVAVAEDPVDAARQQVRLANGVVLTADLVVLAQGYLDRTATAGEVALTEAAERNGLTYVPPGFTADIDLSGLRPGDSVLVRGFGLAFIDLMVLVFEGRGGRFTGSGHDLTYLPCGAEPVLHVGSRRGVPYHAKLGYSLGSAAPVPPVYFTAGVVAALGTPERPADFQRQLWPLMVKELAGAHYRRLFESHPERTLVPFARISAALDEMDVDSRPFRQLIEQAVPDASDRFDLAVIDRPLGGAAFVDQAALSAAMVDYISADLARRADPAFSADHAVFNALLTVYGVLAGALVAGRISAADRVQHIEGEFHGLFSFLASGPPPRRLAEMLALHRAGFVRFAGPDLEVTLSDGAFIGTSPVVGGRISARVLVDARLARPDVRSAADPIISGLLAAGELAAEDLVAPDGRNLGAGQLLADGECRAVRADRSVHPTRFLLGPSVSGSAGSAGFSRPGFNGPGFRQNDRVARALLRLAGQVPGRPIADGAPGQPHSTGLVRAGKPATGRPSLAAPPAHAGHHHSHLDRIETSHAS